MFGIGTRVVRAGESQGERDLEEGAGRVRCRRVMTATPDSGSTFVGWSGGGCSGTGSCSVIVNVDTPVTAIFDEKSGPALPPTKEGGEAKSQRSFASVSGNKAAIRLACGGSGSCEGTLTLRAKVKQGKKQKMVVIGKASFTIAAGQTETIKVKITNAWVKKQLNNGKVVKVRVGGFGVQASAVGLRAGKVRTTDGAQ